MTYLHLCSIIYTNNNIEHRHNKVVEVGIEPTTPPLVVRDALPITPWALLPKAYRYSTTELFPSRSCSRDLDDLRCITAVAPSYIVFSVLTMSKPSNFTHRSNHRIIFNLHQYVKELSSPYHHFQRTFVFQLRMGRESNLGDRQAS